jgi:hypothetical protein
LVIISTLNIIISALLLAWNFVSLFIDTHDERFHYIYYFILVSVVFTAVGFFIHTRMNMEMTVKYCLKRVYLSYPFFLPWSLMTICDIFVSISSMRVDPSQVDNLIYNVLYDLSMMMIVVAVISWEKPLDAHSAWISVVLILIANAMVDIAYYSMILGGIGHLIPTLPFASQIADAVFNILSPIGFIVVCTLKLIRPEKNLCPCIAEKQSGYHSIA